MACSRRHGLIPPFSPTSIYVAGPGCLRYTLPGYGDLTEHNMLTLTDLTTTGGDGNGKTVDGHRLILDCVARIAEESGLKAYLVGGPVRDRLLGVVAADLDITVVGDAMMVAERLAAEIQGRLTVHQRFGTATVVAGSLAIDLVTARREAYPSPGALPIVEPGGIADDLARRDFTINAMAMPLPAVSDQLVDPHDGSADLTAGLIRVLHDGSFRDDPTRILRAVRYAARFGFAIERETADLMGNALSARTLSALSGDRLRHELERTFHERDPVAPLQLADNHEILSAIHPALTARHLPAATREPVAPLAWLAALVWPLDAEEGEALSARLNAPSDWARVIADTARIRRSSPALGDASKPSEVCSLLDGMAPAALRGALIMGRGPAQERISSYLSHWWSVAPRLRGHDLLALGVPAGPEMGATLRELRRARLDGETHSVQDEQELARQWVQAPDKTAN